MNKLQVAIVDRGKLADVLRGIGDSKTDVVTLRDGKLPGKLNAHCVGIGYVDNHSDLLPNFLVIPSSDRREFFAWVNTYCPFATPLSQWCRVINEEELARVKLLEIIPRYGRMASAWAGAVVGEALLNIGIRKRQPQLSVTALQSCASFVAARAFGLWGSGRNLSISMKQYDAARNVLGIADRNSNRLEYENLWMILEALSDNKMQYPKNILHLYTKLIVRSCEDIRNTGFVSRTIMSEVIRELDWSEKLIEFERSGAEQRIVLFDNAVDHLSRSVSETQQNSKMLGEFMVAYFAARIGGSACSHRPLLEKLIDDYPIVVLWYGVVSALYRSEIWGAEFGGLGRLALKELAFPLRFDDPPRCDIAFDELVALVDPNVGPRSLGFRGATHKALNVEVSLGVNAMIRLSPLPEQGSAVISSAVISSEELQSQVAELRRHLESAIESVQRLDSAYGLSTASQSSENRSRLKSRRSQPKKSRPQSRTKNKKSKSDDDRGLVRSDTNSVKTSQMELVE